MDLAGADRDTLLSGLKARLDEGCVDFGPGQDRDSWLENVAVCGEDVLERYLETGEVAEEDIAALIGRGSCSPATSAPPCGWRGWRSCSPA